MHELVTFESASKYITEIITDFKDLIAVEIWELFMSYFGDSYVPKLERITGNEEMGRYAFSAKNDDGDMIECTVNTPGEWNIPLISITGYTTARYRNVDL